MPSSGTAFTGPSWECLPATQVYEQIPSRQPIDYDAHDSDFEEMAAEVAALYTPAATASHHHGNAAIGSVPAPAMMAVTTLVPRVEQPELVARGAHVQAPAAHHTTMPVNPAPIQQVGQPAPTPFVWPTTWPAVGVLSAPAIANADGTLQAFPTAHVGAGNGHPVPVNVVAALPRPVPSTWNRLPVVTESGNGPPLKRLCMKTTVERPLQQPCLAATHVPHHASAAVGSLPLLKDAIAALGDSQHAPLFPGDARLDAPHEILDGASSSAHGVDAQDNANGQANVILSQAQRDAAQRSLSVQPSIAETRKGAEPDLPEVHANGAVLALEPREASNAQLGQTSEVQAVIDVSNGSSVGPSHCHLPLIPGVEFQIVREVSYPVFCFDAVDGPEGYLKVLPTVTKQVRRVLECENREVHTSS